MSDDMSQYLGEYIKEAEDLLEQLNSALLSLEKSPEDPEFINQIFRSSHTLKSSSAAMGFKKISELAHSMEDVLGRIKNREISATKEIVDVLFNCFDALETMLGQVSKNMPEDLDVESIMESLKMIKEMKTTEVTSSDKKESMVMGATGGDLAFSAHTLKSVNYVKVDIERLDKLMNLVGELLINKMRLHQLKSEKGLTLLDEPLNQLGHLVGDLQFEVMQVRLIPIGHIFNRFPRMVRDLSEKEGKKVNFILEGEELELDRTIIDNLGEPLVHLLRNSVDHGIESPELRKTKGKSEEGTIKIVARKEKNTAKIEIIDDGGGFDIQRIKEVAIKKGIFTVEELEKLSENKILMIPFLPNFSTAKVVTDVSGRGVGLDVVKTKIEGMNGKVSVESKYGEGTKFVLDLPLTLAIIPCFLVRIGHDFFGIPLSNVVKSIRIKRSSIKTISGMDSFILKDKDIPLINLGKIFKEGTSEDEDVLVVIVEVDKDIAGIIVDETIGKEDLIIKPLEGIIKNSKGFSGATILGDGKVILILDMNNLLEKAY